jgi:hypothetical protein
MKLSKEDWRNLPRPALAWSYAVWFCVLPMALFLAACAQRDALPTADENVAADQHLPFEGTSDKGGIFPTGSLAPAAIPAGTPVAVHLRATLSSATARSGDSFEATLLEPIIVRGQTLAPRGTILAGRVQEARPAGPLQDSGYMRLALTAVSLQGRSFSIQTSSIFLKGGLPQKHDLRVTTAAQRKTTLLGASIASGSAVPVPYASVNQDAAVAPGRLLTFRLVQPLLF